MDYKLTLGNSFYGAPLVWEDANNGHIAISGQSGSGKSYAMKSYLAQLPTQGVRAIVFDSSGDFRDMEIGSWFGKDGLRLDVMDVREQTKFNPFLPLKLNEFYTEEPADTAARLSGTILDAYQFHGNVQRLYLKAAVEQYILFCTLVTGGHRTPPSFINMVAFINSVRSYAKKMAASLIRVQDLARVFSSGDKACDWRLNEPGITIVKFDGVVDRETQVVITEFLLADLWTQKVGVETNACPIVVVLDECQRFSFGETSMLIRILREGRKFGINRWFASQWVERERAIRALEQASLRAYFYPGDRHIKDLAKTICPNESEMNEYKTLVRGLKRGQFLYVNQHGRTIRNCVPEHKNEEMSVEKMLNLKMTDKKAVHKSHFLSPSEEI